MQNGIATHGYAETPTLVCDERRAESYSPKTCGLGRLQPFGQGSNRPEAAFAESKFRLKLQKGDQQKRKNATDLFVFVPFGK